MSANTRHAGVARATVPTGHVVFGNERLIDRETRGALADVSRHFSRRRLEQAAMQDERARLARELHDGILQALTGATLQLHAVDRLIDQDPARARADVRRVADLLREHQRDLRRWIGTLHAVDAEPRVEANDLADALDKVRERAAWQYAIDISLRVRGTSIPRRLGDEVYRLVQEGMSNIGKHAHARGATVEVELAFDGVTVALVDDGVGFPVQGRFTLQQLLERRSGPASIRERVAALEGELILETSRSGSRLDIRLPVPPG